ncbi:MAG: tryptophan 7-halogenase, partial [Burkholderiales bacterium]|nr:tryptophan 7-halogenase [Burkholderiales bacterium]
MRSTEVCVVGAGPAGSAAAIRLAQLGHRVLLVERGGPGRAPAAESLPPSALPGLEQLGVRAAVEAAGFLRPRGSLVEWDGAAREVDGGGAAGFQVERARLDELLREAAMAAGAGLRRPAAVRSIEHDAGAWRLRLADGETLEAQAVVDARGRRAGAALRPPTAALCAEWQGANACAGHGRVQALREAWVWAAPLPDGRCSVAVFADAARMAALGGPGRAAFYDEAVARAGLLDPVLRHARRGPLRVRDASARRHPTPADERGLLRVGEAACALDPLSSQGLACALRQGVQAAACLHTALVRPADAAWAW